MKLEKIKLGILGLGYVGLPLAVEFGKKIDTVGFDIDTQRVNELRSKIDKTLEIKNADFDAASKLNITADIADLKECNYYIIAVPTPIDAYKRPDLNPLMSASETVAKILKEGDLVIYESTVYPGCTEDECVPVLEKISGLKFNENFFVGYSPERINPGDRLHRVATIKKVVSGSTPQIADLVESLYSQIVIAGTHKASSIKVAEAAKVIENTQRDLNIALINELAIIFNKIGIDTESVLLAAGSKWNFLPFRPGLVGGHCIGVDPYYLTHKAESIGYHPELILAGRRINDGMSTYVSSQLIKAMANRNINLYGSKVLVMGFSFKENCPDMRNSKVKDIVDDLAGYGVVVDIYDPWVDRLLAGEQYKNRIIESPQEGKYDAIMVAVGHACFVEMGVEKLRRLGKSEHIIYDLKHIFPCEETDLRL